MREIKFRAWNKHLGKMKEEICINEYGEVIHFDYGEYAGVTDDIVMQYTGLTDKNGKEIFEGDVVKRTMNDSHINIFIGKVIFHEGTYFIVCGSDCILLWPRYEGEKNEIIGNIYENPHLLEESK